MSDKLKKNYIYLIRFNPKDILAIKSLLDDKKWAFFSKDCSSNIKYDDVPIISTVKNNNFVLKL